MVALMAIAWYAQIQAPLRQADIGLILAAAIESTDVPSRLADWPVFIAFEETIMAFREVIPSARLEPIANFDRRYVAREWKQTVSCTTGGTPRKGCRVTSNAVFVTVTRASETTKPGEYLIVLSVAWSDPEPLSAGEPAIEAYSAHLYVAKVADRWRVVRKGPMAIS